MHRKSLFLALMVAAFAAVGAFASAAFAELTVNERFEYNSPGLTFEGQHVGAAHCKAKYQVNPKRFPQKYQEETNYPQGGREVVNCKFLTPGDTNVEWGHAFPELNPESDYWVSEWFQSFNPNLKCFTITLPKDHVKGKIGIAGRGYHVVAYFEYTRECHEF